MVGRHHEVVSSKGQQGVRTISTGPSICSNCQRPRRKCVERGYGSSDMVLPRCPTTLPWDDGCCLHSGPLVGAFAYVEPCQTGSSNLCSEQGVLPLTRRTRGLLWGWRPPTRFRRFTPSIKYTRRPFLRAACAKDPSFALVIFLRTISSPTPDP